MKIYVISLPASLDRRKAISTQLDTLKLEFEFIDAVWGRDVYNDPALYNASRAIEFEKRELTPGEVGCALSHIIAYQKIIDGSLPYALILEDDAIISSEVPEFLNHIETHLKQNQIVSLERCDVHSPLGIKSVYKKYKLAKPIMVSFGSMCQSAGYIITKDAALRLLSENKPVFIPADAWWYFEKKVDLRGIIPPLTLIKQDVSFECTTQNLKRSEFTKGTVLSLLIYAFKTRSLLGRTLVKVAKKILRRT